MMIHSNTVKKSAHRLSTEYSLKKLDSVQSIFTPWVVTSVITSFVVNIE